MNTENQGKAKQVGRWLDVALLVSTLARPFAKNLLKRSGQGAQSRPVRAAQENAQITQPDIRQRINELALERRQWVTEQVQQLNEQARQLQKQSRQLRNALRHEARQRNKLLEQMRKSGMEWSQDVLKRGERLTGDIVERGGKITQDLLELGGKTAHDLAERSGEFTHELVERSGKVSHDLAKRGEELLEPVRKRDRNFWTIVGFVIGLVAAGVVTYQLVRRRVAQQETEQDEHIELPQSESLNSRQSRPAGEIRRIDQGGTVVATLQTVDVKNTERPAGALYVGVLSTKKYYPVDTALEPDDLVYFASEEEAQTKGFTPA